MKSASALLLLLMAWPAALLGQEAKPPQGETEEWMRKGEAAMNAKLWEVAAHHYQALLASNATDIQRSQASMRLSEALIRDGQSQQALELLEQSLLQAHPETPFWKGQALAATGRFAQAVELLKTQLSPGQPTPPFRFEAGLTAASLELALDQPQEALKTLSLLAEGMDGEKLHLIRLRQINILLDLDRTEEARELMPARDKLPARLQSEADFTEASILLREGQFEEATKSYQFLVENPQNLTLRQFHESWIGWADALLAQDKRTEAGELLLDYIQKHPDSEQLESIFKRLLAALPEEPGPSDPILTRLESWITPAELPPLGLISNIESLAVSAWPLATNSSDLTAFSLYTRAVGLHRQGSPESMKSATSLLNRLWVEFPNHFLASRSLLLRSRWHLDSQETEDAYHLLMTLRETATSPLVKGQAAFIQAHSVAGTGGKPIDAVELYRESAKLLQGIEADTARFNGALIQLIQADAVPAEENPATIEDPVIAANLMLERALANADPTRKQVAIEAFLLAHPDHPRAPEARVNSAETSLILSPPDLSSAKAQIETLEAQPEKHAAVAPARIALIKLRILDLDGAPEQVIASARTLASDFPASPQALEASFILGRNLFETGNYNDARIVLEKLTASLEDSHRIQTAWLLAARSAALIPTSQSQQEALGLFDKAIEIEGPLSNLAKLERARLMIDINLLAETVEYLKPWHEGLDPADPMRLATGLLMAEAVYAQGKLNPDSLPQALSIYDQLLTTAKRFTPEHDRLQYLRGLTLEQLPDPQTPDLKREKEALIAYYSVLEREQAPAQWEYFEASGFRALALLEKSRRWPAAIACAKKIASFKGPRAQEAAARANQIQLKYMIWED